jgi:peroxiredoxin
VISPQLGDAIVPMVEAQKLTFPILWDEKSRVSTAYGLTFSLPEDLKQVYLGFGNNLALRNGDPAWVLPVPSRFVIDAAGIVRSVEADPDYTHRPPVAGTLAALRSVVEG